MSVNPRTVFIAGISSDIGTELAQIYRARGCSVIGTYRNPEFAAQAPEDPDTHLIACDIARPDAPDVVARAMSERGLSWDLFIASVGQLSPIGGFFEVDRAEWTASLTVNGASQLALLHAIHPYRRGNPDAGVAFLVGGAINRAFNNYSAYSLGKIVLTKFCELIHHECPDLHAVAVGTGWVATKIHRQTIAAGERAGENLVRTEEFLRDQHKGTSIADIAGCLDWCFAQDRDVTGGRNFSVVHDAWRDGGTALIEALRRDGEKFKLRRHGNSLAGGVPPS